MASTATALVPIEESAIAVALDDQAQALLELLPGPAAVARFRRVVLQAMGKTPDLLNCTPASVISSVLEAAAMGLEPTGAAGGAHLVPRNVKVSRKGEQDRWEKRAQLVPDFRGVVAMVTRPAPDGTPSDVVSVESRLVKEGDEFAVTYGSGETLVTHVPSLSPTRSAKPTTHVYAVARLRAGGSITDVMDRAEVEKIRNRGKAEAFSPWNSDWDEMARKTVVKRLSKMLPIRPDVRALLVREDELEPEPAAAPAAPVAIAAPRTRQLAAKLAPPAPVPAQAAPSAPDEPEVDEDAIDGEFSEQRTTAGPVDRDTFRALARDRGWKAGDLEAARTALNIGDVDDEARGEIAAWLTGRDAA